MVATISPPPLPPLRGEAWADDGIFAPDVEPPGGLDGADGTTGVPVPNLATMIPAPLAPMAPQLPGIPQMPQMPQLPTMPATPALPSNAPAAPQQVLRALAAFGTRPDDEGSADRSGKFAYWRTADGWVTYAPAWPTEASRQYDKGMQKLTRYGDFPARNVPERWYLSQEPWRRLFQLGGAAEFPVEQVVAFGWHRKPPYMGVTFPQLAQYAPHDVQCPYPGCRRWFVTPEDLAKHESVMHRETSAQNQLARGLAQASAVSSEPVAKALQQMGNALVQVMAQQAQMQQAMLVLLDRAGLTLPGPKATPAPAAPLPASDAPVTPEAKIEAAREVGRKRLAQQAAAAAAAAAKEQAPDGGFTAPTADTAEAPADPEPEQEVAHA